MLCVARGDEVPIQALPPSTPFQTQRQRHRATPPPPTPPVGRPPGELGKFTKLIQFFPRLVVINHIDRPLALVQAEPQTFGCMDRKTRRNLDTKSRHRSRRPRARAAETAPREWQPFHLPFARGAGELHLYLGEKFQHSASIPVDQAGEYPLSLRPIVHVEHRSARAEDVYQVVLPSRALARRQSSGRFQWSEGLGLVFEIDRFNDCVVVKEVGASGRLLFLACWGGGLTRRSRSGPQVRTLST